MDQVIKANQKTQQSIRNLQIESFHTKKSNIVEDKYDELQFGSNIQLSLNNSVKSDVLKTDLTPLEILIILKDREQHYQEIQEMDGYSDNEMPHKDEKDASHRNREIYDIVNSSTGILKLTKHLFIKEHYYEEEEDQFQESWTKLVLTILIKITYDPQLNKYAISFESISRDYKLECMKVILEIKQHLRSF